MYGHVRWLTMSMLHPACVTMSVRFRTGGGDGRLPPGFRFRPTDEELLTHYLAPKAADAGFAPAAVREVDLYRAEPWDLLPAGGGGGGGGYFFCRRSVKFPSGLRTNRATRAGYWKSTGKDKVVLRQHGGGGSIGSGHGEPLGMRKTLVFYRGRAPTGEKTNWVMHEYRLVQGHGCYTSPLLEAGTQVIFCTTTCPFDHPFYVYSGSIYYDKFWLPV